MKIVGRKAMLIGAMIAVAAFTVMLSYRNVTPKGFAAEGERFRERTVKQFNNQAKSGFGRYIDMAAFCKAERFDGMPLHQVQEMFRAAGSKGLVDVSTLAENVRKANDADYFGVFDVGSSLFGDVTFSMGFRVQRTNGIVALKEITSCGVTSVYL